MEAIVRELLAEVDRYYSEKLATHGMTPEGVDWNGGASQRLRFAQLTKIIDATQDFCLADLGCGYGAMVEYLEAHFSHYHYTGVDVSADMVRSAAQRFAAQSHVTFVEGSAVTTPHDYVVASGIFNVRQQRSDAEWHDYIIATLDAMHVSATRGFAANFLTSYSDADKKRDYLYYADPLALFDHCKRHYSRQVALLHDYGLYEFTLLVRNDA
jgi:SAM-dependent methyltransferase